MAGSLLAIGLLLLAGWFWLDSLRAREMALFVVQRRCENDHQQWLDQTVMLKTLRLHWGAQGVRFKRRYGFEFSNEGTIREHGELSLIGLEVEFITLASDTQNEQLFDDA